MTLLSFFASEEENKINYTNVIISFSFLQLGALFGVGAVNCSFRPTLKECPLRRLYEVEV